jgi:rhodanese-related sulfurtransferase
MTSATAYFEQKLLHETDPSDLFDALEQNTQRIIVIDARREEFYTREHIPGAVNLPHRQMNEVTTAKFDREALYVTYCDGIGCNASTKGARNMSRLGFQVRELIGGL